METEWPETLVKLLCCLGERTKSLSIQTLYGLVAPCSCPNWALLHLRGSALQMDTLTAQAAHVFSRDAAHLSTHFSFSVTQQRLSCPSMLTCVCVTLLTSCGFQRCPAGGMSQVSTPGLVMLPPTVPHYPQAEGWWEITHSDSFSLGAPVPREMITKPDFW